MQVDPGYPVVFAVDPTLAFRHFQLLKLKYDIPLSKCAFDCKLRHYTLDVCRVGDGLCIGVSGRGVQMFHLE